MMKYAVNHPWKFRDYKLAWFAGFMLVSVSFLIEIVTFFVLLFDTDAIFDVLGNYAIVLVIADFGSNFYALELDKKNKEIITSEKYEELLVWEVTTSTSADKDDPENKLEDENVLWGDLVN